MTGHPQDDPPDPANSGLPGQPPTPPGPADPGRPDWGLCQKAWLLAARRHHGQAYPGTGLPYICHIGMVVLALQPALPELEPRQALIATLCAILHDVVEDTPTTAEEIAEAFGGEVAAGVSALSKRPDLRGQAAMEDSLGRIEARGRPVAMVKLADRTANLGVPPAHWTPAKIRGYALEGQMILERLGPASPALSEALAARIGAWLAL
jgi:(p)ppGpp synthase/HD superfamily hydrolase